MLKGELRDGKWSCIAQVLGEYSKSEIAQLSKALFGSSDNDPLEDVMERTVSG